MRRVLKRYKVISEPQSALDGICDLDLRIQTNGLLLDERTRESLDHALVPRHVRPGTWPLARHQRKARGRRPRPSASVRLPGECF